MRKQTFIVEVTDTQDGTWQGRVNWVDGRKEQNFRSVMELLRLIDPVVCGERDCCSGDDTSKSGLD